MKPEELTSISDAIGKLAVGLAQEEATCEGGSRLLGTAITALHSAKDCIKGYAANPPAKKKVEAVTAPAKPDQSPATATPAPTA